MPGKTPPVINLELSGGTLVIRSPEATYQISVAGSPAGSAAPLNPAPAIAAPAPAPPEAPASDDPLSEDWALDDLPAIPARAEDDPAYFEQLSRDMYKAVGSLARRLSMSIHDVEKSQVEKFDLQDAGDQLELAKDQLENVVKMTEKATIRIIDLGEDIQQAADKARSIMQSLDVAPSDSGDNAATEARSQLAESIAKVSGFVSGLGEDPLAGVLEKAKGLQEALSGGGAPAAAEPEPEPAAEEPQVLKYDFPLDLVFQTTYEMCTNEAVKKHIKAMWDNAAKGFDQAQVNQMLNVIAPEAPDEDNFLNLDLTEVMKALFKATGVDKFKAVLKKIAGTADQIFLEPSLPIEAMPGKAQAAPAKPAPKPAPKAPPAAGPGPEVMERLSALVQEVEAAKTNLAAPELPEDMSALLDKAASEGGGAALDQASRQELDEVMNVIFTSVNGIIEALSFQDLSGQAIYRIVRLLTDFQVQLLAMVVSFGIKIKAKSEKAEISADESDRMAQEEVDKVMESLGLGDEQAEGEQAPSKLDQDSVNNLLETLGF